MENNHLYKSSTNCIRGFACICIIFCHLHWKDLNPCNPILLFKETGSVAVGVFFFYTGYNLIWAYQHSDIFDVKRFLQKKMFRIVIPFWTTNLAYCIFEFLIGDDIKGKDVWAYIIGIKLINSTSWYVIAVLSIYIIFALVFYVYSKQEYHNCVMTLCMFLLVMLLYAMLCSVALKYVHRGFTKPLNQYPLSLFIGALFACIKNMHIKPYKIGSITLFLGIIGWCACSKVVPYLYISVGVWKYIVPSLVAVTLNCLIWDVEIHCCFLEKIAEYSFEAYILHFLCMLLYRQKLWVKFDILFMILYLVTLMILSIALHKVVLLIEKKCGAYKK